MRLASLTVLLLLAVGCGQGGSRVTANPDWPGRLFWIDLQGDLLTANLDGSKPQTIVRGAKILGGFTVSLEGGRAVLMARGVGRLTNSLALAERDSVSPEDMRRGLPAIDAPGEFVPVEYRHGANSSEQDCLPGPLLEIYVPGHAKGAWKVEANEGCNRGPRVAGIAKAGVAWVQANDALWLWDYRTGSATRLLEVRDAAIWPRPNAADERYPEMRSGAKVWKLATPDGWKR